MADVISIPTSTPAQQMRLKKNGGGPVEEYAWILGEVNSTGANHKIGTVAANDAAAVFAGFLPDEVYEFSIYDNTSAATLETGTAPNVYVCIGGPGLAIGDFTSTNAYLQATSNRPWFRVHFPSAGLSAIGFRTVAGGTKPIAIYAKRLI